MKKLLIVAWLLSACASSPLVVESDLKFDLSQDVLSGEDASSKQLGIEYLPERNLVVLNNRSSKGIEVRLDSLMVIFDSRAHGALGADFNPNIELTESSSTSVVPNSNASVISSQTFGGLTFYSSQGSPSLNFGSSKTIKKKNQEIIYLPAGSSVSLPVDGLLYGLYRYYAEGIRRRLGFIWVQNDCDLKVLSVTEPCYIQSKEQLRSFLDLLKTGFNGKSLAFEVLFRQINQTSWVSRRVGYTVNNPIAQIRKYSGQKLISI